MKKRLLHFWNGIDSLDDKIYYSVVFIGAVAALMAYVMGLVQNLSPAAGLSTLACSLWMAALLVIGVFRPKSLPLCRIVLVVGLTVMLPPTYYACGGLTSGMVLFYLVTLFLIAVLLSGRTRAVLFGGSLLVLGYSLHYGWYHPELIHPLTPRQEYEDVLMTFCTTGIALGAMTVGILRAYNNERRRNQELMDQLSNLSVHDALSGLYNRRELFRRLDLVYKPPQQTARADRLKLDGCYIAMFDIDNFKRLNDTYGHQFGDTVLAAVAKTLQDAVTSGKGEFAARYGGEEFVCVLYADSLDEAYQRVDAMRRAVSDLRWEKAQKLVVTVSGGLVSCEEHTPLDQAIHDVDTLLYQAKRSGKNRIVSHDMPPDETTR